MNDKEEFQDWLDKIEQDLKNSPEIKNQEYLKNLDKEVSQEYLKNLKKNVSSDEPEIGSDTLSQKLIEVYHILFGNEDEENLPIFVKLGKKHIYRWGKLFLRLASISDIVEEDLRPYTISVHGNMRKMRFDVEEITGSKLSKLARSSVFPLPENSSPTSEYIMRKLLTCLFNYPNIPLTAGPGSFITVSLDKILQFPDVYSYRRGNTVFFYPKINRIVGSKLHAPDMIEAYAYAMIDVPKLFDEVYELTDFIPFKDIAEEMREFHAQPISLENFFKLAASEDIDHGGLAPLFIEIITKKYLADFCEALTPYVLKNHTFIPDYYRAGSILQDSIRGNILFYENLPIEGIVFKKS